jgi:hypothetical protein
MIPRSALVLAILALGCRDRTPPPDAVEQGAVADSLDEAAVEAELPPMPDFPSGRSGQVTARAVGAFALDRGWPAHAGRCARPAMVVIIAQEPGSGVSLLLQLPDADDLTGRYPVRLADSAGMLTPPAAQLGFQFFESGAADAYQAAEGEVDVRELTDRRVSGRFAVTARHIVNNRLANVAGAFQQVEVEALSLDWCADYAAGLDSLARDSTAGGT